MNCDLLYFIECIRWLIYFVLNIVYVHNKLLHASTKHVAILRDIKHTG